MSENVQENNYIAFISYRHKPLDKEAAERIQRSIERFAVPKEFREKAGGKKLGRVFRDEDELPVSSNLSDSILYALDHSKYLIVICTPDLPLSKWCEQEIRYFISTHDRDHVIAVLADGEPEKSFSPYLLHYFDEEGNITGDIEPLAANIAGEDHKISNKNFKKEIVRIYAALLGCPFDALWQRERRARTNRFMALMGIAAAAMAAFSIVVLSKNKEIRTQSDQIQEQNTQILEQNGQITAQNQQITAQNGQITEQNRDLQRQLSRILVDAGYNDLENYNLKGALRNGVDALLEGENAALHDRRAEVLLNQALGAYQVNYEQSSIIYEQSTPLTALAVPEDGSCALVLDELGAVSCLELPRGTVRWTVRTLADGESIDFDENASLNIVEAEKTVICKTMRNITALSLEDGAVRWEYRYRYSDGNNFLAFSEDMSRLALLDIADEEAVTPSCLYVLDTAAGAELVSVELGSDDYTFEASGMLERFGHDYGAVFSNGGEQIDIALIAAPMEDGERAEKSAFYFLRVDLKEKKIVRINSFGHFYDGSVTIICGMHKGKDDLFCALYSFAYGGVYTVRIPDDPHEESTLNFVHQSLRSWSGAPSRWEKHYVTPMIADDHVAVVFVDNSLLLYDRATAEQKKTLDLMGAVRNAYWLDPEEEVVEVLLDYGGYCAFDLEAGDGAFTSYSCSSFEQNGVFLFEAVGAGLQMGVFDVPEGGMFLTVREDHPGQLVLVRKITDPAIQLAPEKPGEYSSPEVRETPSGSLMLFYNTSTGYDTEESEFTVIVCDAESMQETARCSFAGSLEDQIIALDDSHFLNGFTIYGTDGSTEYLDKITEKNKDTYRYDDCYHARLSDGRVVSMMDRSSSWKVNVCPCWIDGKIVGASLDLSTGIAMLDREFFGVGPNGYAVAYGTCAYKDSSGETVQTETPGFIAYDMIRGQRSLLEDPCPEAEKKCIVIGTEKPLFAFACEDGSVFLCETETLSARKFGPAYGAGEIKLMCFAEGDEYLLVLTESGRLDIYELQSGETVFSELVSGMESLSKYSEIRAARDAGNKRLHVLGGSSVWLCIDTETWMVSAMRTGTIYGWLRGSNRLCFLSARNNDRRVASVPVRSLDELAGWAREELAGYEGLD